MEETKSEEPQQISPKNSPHVSDDEDGFVSNRPPKEKCEICKDADCKCIF